MLKGVILPSESQEARGVRVSVQAKHTPGPWSNPPDCRHLIYDHPFGGGLICDMADRHESKANACLIAAAPDLLAALKESPHDAECHPSEGKHSERCLRARAAIAKAEGRAE